MWTSSRELYFSSFTYLFIYEEIGINSLSDAKLGFDAKTQKWSCPPVDAVIQFAEGQNHTCARTVAQWNDTQPRVGRATKASWRGVKERLDRNKK